MKRKTSTLSAGGTSTLGSSGQNADMVSRFQNATSNVMGRISDIGRGVSGGVTGFGGIANKFLNNL